MMPLRSGVTPPRSGYRPSRLVPKEMFDFASSTASFGAAPSGFNSARLRAVIFRISSAV
jgi:hypothetical protein